MAVVATACAEPTAPAEDPSYRTFDCVNPIDVLDEPPDDWSTILDVIAFPNDSTLQRGRFDDEVGRALLKLVWSSELTSLSS